MARLKQDFQIEAENRRVIQTFEVGRLKGDRDEEQATFLTVA